MSKKTIISSLLMNNVTTNFSAAYFRVGDIPLRVDGSICADANGVPAFPLVTDIIFCRHAYGQGAQIDQPCYVISFEDSLEKVIVPADKFSQTTIIVVDSKDTKIPAMPED